ncbi:hypothetical protein AAMO2058_000907900 [Amorphochlora amoebiformis]
MSVEWNCSVCTFRNPGTTSSCGACGVGTKPGGGGGEGGDQGWVCKRCTYRNPGVSKCGMCGNPSSSSSTETRTQSLGDCKPDKVFISSDSQFTYGGESACAFGSLCVGEALLMGLDVFGEKEEGKKAVKDIKTLLSTAAKNFQDYFGSGTRGHASQREILQNQSKRYPNLKLQKWSSVPTELQDVKASLVFPEALLPGGEIQLANANRSHIKKVLCGFQGKDVVIGMVTVGYAFGIFCRRDGTFIVFDTHKKSFDKIGEKKAGAYCALFSSPDKAACFVDAFPLDSRNKILELARGFQQSQAASNIDITVIKYARPQPKETDEKRVLEAKIQAQTSSSGSQVSQGRQIAEGEEEKNSQSYS